MRKPSVAVHKFSSCDGCQLALLNAGETLLELAEKLEIVYFAEAGMLAEDAQVDIAFVEGSINNAHDVERIQQVRAHSHYLIGMGACATAGGVQAKDALAKHVKVDWELWGCPVNTQQVLQVITSLLHGATPPLPTETVCAECKRRGNVCILVTEGKTCLGHATHSGCGAICPAFGRGCYGCYGPQGVIYAGAA